MFRHLRALRAVHSFARHHASSTRANLGKTEKITIRYWNCQARGQVIRYMLFDSGHPFVDEIPVNAEEAQELQAAGKMGVCNYLPVYEGPDGEGGTLQLGQNKAIVHHVSKLLGYAPASSREYATADEAFHLAAEDVYSPIFLGIWQGAASGEAISLVSAMPGVCKCLLQLETPCKCACTSTCRSARICACDNV